MKTFAATLLLGSASAYHHGSYSKGLRTLGGYSSGSGLRYSSGRLGGYSSGLGLRSGRLYGGALLRTNGLRLALNRGTISAGTGRLIQTRAGGQVLGSGLRLARGLRLGAVAVPVRRVDLVPETVIAQQARTVLDAVQRQVTELQT